MLSLFALKYLSFIILFNDFILVFKNLLNRRFFLAYKSYLLFLLKIIKSIIYKYLLLKTCYVKLTSIKIDYCYFIIFYII